jgi:N-hydroxyarylamine O-acetyltransferase
MSSEDLFERYLGALGIAQQEPSLEALSELMAAHLARIPFENVSKLYYRHELSRRTVPDLARFLDGIERCHFGGTCYTNNFHVHQLLAHLGYEVMLCGADMATPNVHMVNLVTLDRRRYLVDMGYGAPLRTPLPLDGADDREIAWGPFRYVLRPRDAAGRSRLDMFRDGVLTHGYTVIPAPRRLDDFAAVIADSFSEQATFMNALLVSRYGAQRSVMLRNLTLFATQDGRCTSDQAAGREQLPDIIEREFRIPREVARQALADVQLIRQP